MNVDLSYDEAFNIEFALNDKLKELYDFRKNEEFFNDKFYLEHIDKLIFDLRKLRDKIEYIKSKTNPVPFYDRDIE